MSNPFPLPTLRLRGKIISIVVVFLISLIVLGATFFVEKRALDQLNAHLELEFVKVEALTELILVLDTQSLELSLAVAERTEAQVQAVETAIKALAANIQEPGVEIGPSKAITSLSARAKAILGNLSEIGLSQSTGLIGRTEEAAISVESALSEDLTNGSGENLALVHFLQLRSHEKNFRLSGAQADVDLFNAAIDGLSKEVGTSVDDASQAQQTQALITAYRDTFGELVSEKMKLHDGFTRYGQVYELVKAALHVELEAAVADHSLLSAKVNDEWSAFTGSFITILVIAVAVGLTLATLIGRSIQLPVVRLSSTMRALADGDLDVEVHGAEMKDEIGEMAKTVEVFHEKLKEIRSHDEKAKVFLAEAADYQGQINAISRAQAVIEFTLDGKILKANENFLGAMGYRLDEVVGKHHSIFVHDKTVQSAEYKEFWTSLARGEYRADEFLRVDKNGNDVWIQASYNAILDVDGNPVKVVKYATDITASKRAVQQLSDGLAKLAEGDLTARIEGDIDPNFEAVKASYNSTMERLSTLVKDIKQASRSMALDTEDISTGSQKLSQRTTEQAAALEETNAAMEDMSVKITSTSKNAEDVDAAATEATASAMQGKTAADDAISAMDRIETSSDKISDIIAVIESIAFQTNLLALNAAVEAARAGDAGKGFAVVASEVRTLAQRSSEAASDITDLIQRATCEVEEGAKLVRATGDALAKINEVVSTVGSNVKKITATSAGQAADVTQISATISDLDSKTQENAQLSENSASNAQKLAAAADGLIKLVSYFSSDNSEQALDESWSELEKRSA